MDTIKTYLCDPAKNTTCRGRFEKGWCGVICQLTTNEEFSADCVVRKGNRARVIRKQSDDRATGRWIVRNDSDEDGIPFAEYYECSECGGISYNKGNYCSDCGAKMEVET